MASYLYDVEYIKTILPHRFPMLLVDRILEMDPGKRAVGLKNITINEDFFNGHFPQKAVMPGVLLLEAMAQVGAVMLLVLPDQGGKLTFFTGIDNVKFRKVVVPGDTLISEVTVLRFRGRNGKVSCIGKVDGEVVVEAEMMFALIDPPASDATESIEGGEA